MTPFYVLGWAFCRFVAFCCLRRVVLHEERLHRPGGFVLACSHLGNVEPALMGAMSRRKIDWMSRVEFFRHPLAARVLHALDAFPVDRGGRCVGAIRTAIDRARGGRIVGIFPEGGVATGRESVLRGGPIRRGACVVANRAAVPILPVAVVGTDQLDRVGPWLPFKRARVWIVVGRPVAPRPGRPRRAARDALAEDLRAEFRTMYRELCAACGLEEERAAGPDAREEPACRREPRGEGRASGAGRAGAANLLRLPSRDFRAGHE